MSDSKKIARIKKTLIEKKGIIAVAIIIGSIVLSGILFFASIGNAKKSSLDSFAQNYEETKQNTYDQFKQMAFDYNEKKNHVSNRATLTIGNIKEENSLEVLTVGDSWVKISNPDIDKDRTRRWVEFSASGVYVVDMSLSEFIIDDYNNFVIVKLKTPQLSHIALTDETEIYLFEYEKGLFTKDGNDDLGTKLAFKDRKEAFIKLTEQLQDNKENIEIAKKSAESFIRTFIKNANPDINLKDSDIQIQFIP